MINEKQYYLISILLIIIGILLLFLSPWFLLLNIIIGGIALIISPPINQRIKMKKLEEAFEEPSPDKMYTHFTDQNVIDDFMAFCIRTTGTNIETDTVISFTAIHFANGIPENGYEAHVENASDDEIKKSLSGFLDYLKRSLWVSYNMPLAQAFLERESQKYALDAKGIESLCFSSSPMLLMTSFVRNLNWN